MLYYMCKESDAPPNWKQLEHAIKRNFGGFESKELSPFEEFEKVIPMSQELSKKVGFIVAFVVVHYLM